MSAARGNVSRRVGAAGASGRSTCRAVPRRAASAASGPPPSRSRSTRPELPRLGVAERTAAGRRAETVRPAATTDVARPPFRAGRGYWAGLTPADVPRTGWGGEAGRGRGCFGGADAGGCSADGVGRRSRAGPPMFGRADAGGCSADVRWGGEAGRGRGCSAGLTPADVPRTYVARPPVRRPPGGAGPAARPGRAVNPSWRRGVVASWLRLGAFPTSGQPGCVADPSGARRQFLGRAGHFPAGTDLPLEPLDPGVAGMVLPTAACSCRFGWCGLNR